MSGPHLILVDCDGVLTDGALTIDHKGEKLFKRYCTRDVRAIRELIHNGYEVVIVTADDWGGTAHFAAKVGAEVCYLRDKREIPYPEGSYYAVGDDAWDVPMLERAAQAYCPIGADHSVQMVDGIIQLDVEGGKGVMAELVRRLVR